MSDGRGGMNRQFRNAHRQSFDSTSQLYPQREPAPGGGRGEVPSDDMLGGNPHFSDFNFPFSAMPDQAVLAHQTDPFSQHQAGTISSIPPSHSMSAISNIARQPFVPIIDPPTPNLELTSSSMARISTPASNSITDDGNADDFGHMNQNRGDGTDLGGKSKDDSASAPPAWSELKTKAGKDRKRLPLACIACRRKKIRCSGEKPACKHCMRSRIPCVYKVTTRKAAPRTDYMAMLDKRLKRMEERIIKILPKSDQDSISSVPRAVVKPAIPGTGTMTSNKTTTKKRNADEAFGRNLEAWAKAPRPKLPEDHAGTPESREAEENELLREGRDALPPKDVQEHLTEVFFDNVYGQSYHLLHKPSYIRKLKNDTLPPVLVLSVCAIAARFTSSPKFTSSTKQFMRGEEWASHAREICTRRYDWPNITILTCLLILGMHEFGTCHGGRAWALGGQAIRMAFALHLHKDLEYDPQMRNRKIKLSFIDREIRRRVMWACFMMDRFNSSGTDRPLFIKEDTLKIPLPVAERHFQFDMPAQTEYLDGTVPNSELSDQGQTGVLPRDNMGAAAYTIRSISIWGRVVTYLNQGGREQDAYPMWDTNSQYAKLVRDTEELLRTLPDSLKCTREALEIHRAESTAKHFIFLHMAIQQNLLFLHQAAVSFSRDRIGEEAPNEFITQANIKTFLAANKISDLLRDAEEVQCSISTPFAGYCAFSSATIHITGIFSGNPAMKATAEANSSVNVRFLRSMMKYWGMFHWMVENIRIQFRNALETSRTGGPTNGSTASSPILQYSDWFNRYPHGVSDTDYMDPAMYRKKEKGEDGALEQKSELQSIEDFFMTVGPMQNDKEGPRAGASKRKAPLKRPAVTISSSLDQQKSGEQLTAAASEQHLHEQMSPANAAQFPQSMPFSNFFSTDMLSMDMEPPDTMMQSNYSDFSMESGSVNGLQNMMNGSTSWGNMSGNNAAANTQIHGQQSMKVDGMSGEHAHAQGQMDQSHNGLTPYLNQNASPGWFLNLDGGQDMGFGSVDPFAALFGSNGGMLMADHQGGM
ncbi:uncharacterized transcriptional regulatory protein C1327.01c [Trichoderma asperellum]|uniref:Uncharacterized transcriptional regulatory protein C1327.01c n=1 Tax=Trichoderma asperellum TaxID=101201 RepID=A0A6V8QZS4_TRIAP|nr:uncharacterized transcriptional regulatory protein C1327.01c [Trichoderma asperellum]